MDNINGERFKVFSGSNLLLIKNNKILLSRRKNTNFDDGKYALIAGHLDAGETLRETACREALEEVGIKIHPEDLIPLHILHKKDPIREYVVVFFSVKKWENEPKNMEPEKCYEINWFDTNNLPEDTSDLMKATIPKLLKGELYSEFGWDTK